MCCSRSVECAGRGGANLSSASRGGWGRSSRDHAILQCLGVYGSRKCHFCDLLSPGRDQTKALPRLRGNALPVHFVSGLGLLIDTLVSGLLQFVGTRNITFLGQSHSLGQLSSILLYL